MPLKGMCEMIGNPFLNYFALGLLVLVAVVIFYGIIAMAGGVSLFTLHVLWPFLWIWAMAYRPERGWGFFQTAPGSSGTAVPRGRGGLWLYP